jgi:hypothetical protein
MRGGDPDAAVYWLMRMLEAGEDPLFVARRMVIFAAEDVGNAEPQALAIAVAAKDAVHFVGLPEGRLALAQAATYLATCPKSNAAMRAMVAATEDVRARGPLPVPLHLRNAPTPLMKGLGYGGGYEYPHDPPCRRGAGLLPDELRGQPTTSRATAATSARSRSACGRGAARVNPTPATPDAVRLGTRVFSTLRRQYPRTVRSVHRTVRRSPSRSRSVRHRSPHATRADERSEPMATLMDTLRGLLTPDLVSQASTVLGESQGSVSRGLSSALPAILAGLLAKSGDSGIMRQLMDLLMDRSIDPGAARNPGDLMGAGGLAKSPLVDLGTRFLSTIFGTQTGVFSCTIATAA